MGWSKKRTHRHGLAVVTSIFLHALLLLSAYYLPLRQSPTASSSGYSIVLNTGLPCSESKGVSKKPSQPGSTATQLPKKDAQRTSVAVEGKQASQEEKVEKKKSEADTIAHEVEQAEESMDERGLYGANQAKQTGTLLEFVGWIWDAMPQPQDDTDESGKLVFEIKVDELGEVVAVKTLEKTVSPVVEKIYQDALVKLTFSKTANDAAYAPISTGRVTFVIQAK